MGEMSASQMINQVNELKQRVRSLLENSKRRIIYQIWALNPAANADYQMYGNGDTTKDGRDYEKFEREIDLVLNSPSIAKIRVTMTDGKKSLGDTELVIKPAYAQMSISFPKPISTPAEHVEPQAPPKPQMNTQTFADLLVQSFGLNGADDTFGGLGAILAVRDKLTENKYEKRSMEDKMQRLVEENAVLKSEKARMESERDKLESELDDAEDKIDELQGIVREYEAINPKRDMISGLLSGIFTEGVVGALKKSTFAASLGFVDNETVPAAIPTVPVVPIEETKPESPRQKYNDAILKFTDTLTDEQFGMLWHLLGIFKNQPTAIQQCFAWATGGTQSAQQTTAAAVPLNGDEEEVYGD